MSHDAPITIRPSWPRRLAIALATLILCSCRAPIQSPPPSSISREPAGERAPSPALPSHNASQTRLVSYHEPCDAGFGCADGGYGSAGCVGMEGCPPGPWAPPGLACPWPYDEYLCDGGDRLPPVLVAPDWSIYGLEDEDAIVHYDQLDGRTEVEATNRVCIYAPRFASVRHVTPLNQYAGLNPAARIHAPTIMARQQDVQIAAKATQREPAAIDLGIKRMTTLRGRDTVGAFSRALLAHEFDGAYKAHEDFTIIRMGIYKQAEKAMLSERIDAAIAWTADVGMQVVVEGHEALVYTGDKKAQATYTVDLNPPAQLRLCKVADKCDAKPGEEVSFTIRFDNVGLSPMGNVTIADNLTARLEFIPGSEQSSARANFSTQPNEHGSLVLRWEITDPIKPGGGGAVRFKARVR